MHSFLFWLESTAFSTWLRESESVFAFPTILTIHTITMGFVAGTNAAIDLRVLGFAPGVPIKEMERFYRVMWVSFWISVVTGIVILMAYPTKAVMNPIFYVKLALIALGLQIVRLMRKHVFGDPQLGGSPMAPTGRMLAIVSLICWVGVITAGRLLPYTYGRFLSIENY